MKDMSSWVNTEKLAMKRAFRTGQITESSRIGSWIKFLSSLPDTNTILDVGTWSGSGTTLCIAKGVISRKHKNLDEVIVVGVELNKEFAAMAKKRLRKFPFIKVIQGSLIGTDQLDTTELSDEEKVWLNGDLALMRDAPVILSEIPMSLDLVILDGGEFSTYAEYIQLKDRFSRWVVLDDVRVRKNTRVLESLQSDTDFVPVYFDDERNGVAIFRRR